MPSHQNQVKKNNEYRIVLAALFIGPRLIDHRNEINELKQLINTLGGTVIDSVVQYRKNIDSKYYIGKGKLQSILDFSLENNCKYIVFNNELSPSHIKNIQKYFKDKVMVKDRTGIILDIFNKHAKTKEAKTQIKLAQLEYLLPRLTRQWTHLERQMGGIGTRGGPGETQIEIDRRLIRNQIIKLKQELSRIANTRKIQKKNRKNIFKVSLVGYTNAGKSTLMQRMSGKKVYIKDELFATLDTNTKKISIDKNNHFILSDTVGFIRNLPDNLIASFRSTLSELIDSDLLLKVIDIGSEEYKTHLDSIHNVLNYLEISDKNSIIIFNKVDTLNNKTLINNLKKTYANSIFISAFKNINIELISNQIKNILNKNNISKTITIPYEKIKFIGEIYDNFEVIKRLDEDEYIKLTVSGSKSKIIDILSQIKK